MNFSEISDRFNINIISIDKLINICDNVVRSWFHEILSQSN